MTGSPLMNFKNLLWIAFSCNLFNAQEDIQKTKSLWHVYRESKKSKDAHSLYALAHIKDGGNHQPYHFLDIEKKGKTHCCQNSVSPYAEYYILKSLYDIQSDAVHHLPHDITARFLMSQKFGQGCAKNLYSPYVRNYAYRLYRNVYRTIDEYFHGEMISYVPFCNFSTPYGRLCTYINKMPNVAIQELITEQDVEKLSKIVQSFGDKVREDYYRPVPPNGLLLRADFVHEQDMHEYLSLKEIEAKLKHEKKHLRALEKNNAELECVNTRKKIEILQKDWQQKSELFLKNVKEEAVTVTAYSFFPDTIKEFHTDFGHIVDDIKKRYGEII